MSDPTTSAPAYDPSVSRTRISTRAFTIGALAVALLTACVVSVWASSHPDGLEFVAHATGFADSAQDSATAGGPFADYGVVFVQNPWLSVAIAGALGCAVTFGLAWLVGRATKHSRADG